MCAYKLKSKESAANFNYVFTCVKDDGTEMEIKVTADNDTKAEQLAQLSHTESMTGSILKTVRGINMENKGTIYYGFKHPDNNFPGHVLLAINNDRIYSFNTNDILEETRLPNGMVCLEIRDQSIGYLSTPFRVGMPLDDFSSITDHLVAPMPAPKKGDPKLATKEDVDRLRKLTLRQGSLASVATFWSGAGNCVLGSTPPNNCAHYLSDAFVRAGYSELIRKKSENKGIFTAWCDTITPPHKRNDNARPIKALEMKNWFNSMATKKETTKQTNSGFWAVYQFDASKNQGHVLLYDSDNNIVYGTGGIGYWDWAQNFYQW